jgi:hypothetical protein
MNRKRLAASSALAALLIGMIACGPGTQAQATSAPAVAPTNPPTQPAEPQQDTAAASESTPVPSTVDPCAFLTADEVQAVLGAPTEGMLDPTTQACNYLTATGGLVVSVGTGDAGKQLFMQGMAIGLNSSEGEQVRPIYDQVNANLANLTISQVFEQMIPFYQGLGYTVTPEAGIGDAAYWLRLEPQNLSGVTAIRGQSWMSLLLVGPDEQAARAVLIPLAQSSIGRLP